MELRFGCKEKEKSVRQIAFDSYSMKCLVKI